MRRTLWIVTVVVICIAGVVFFWLRLTKQPTSYSPTNSLYSVLIASNSAFAKADLDFRAGDFAQAYQEYELALPNAQDTAQEGDIKLKIANSYESMNNSADYLGAVPLFKEIATNTSYMPITRAYAIQELGQMFYKYSDPKITGAIFSDQPYKSMYVNADVLLSYRHLYEYSSSFYPLAISELRIADWYAKSVVSLSKSTTAASTTASTIADYKNIIRQKITSANKDITRITGTAEATAIPGATQREAVIVARLASVGDTSFGDWEALMQQALNMTALGVPGNDGYARYYYASFLAQIYGEKRVTDIQNLLAPIYTSSQYTSAPVTLFVKNEKDNVLKAKNSLVRLAGFDPKFKTYLISLGWQESDFSTFSAVNADN